MTEYDYSPEARARFAATQRRISEWARATPSAAQLASPFKPRSDAGGATTRTGSAHTSSSRTSSRAPSVTPSQSISQASYRPHSSRTHSSHSSQSSGSRSSHSLPPAAPVVSPYMRVYTPPLAARGVVIFPHRGQAPSIVFY
ncbi:hypothetical protein B0H15DRAFT_1027287 [Mycena belliarum]|uniref:Uncharacterized protein n=1 Tax=Mycena belliarum TaxID=1033014 RepID=A0AAD6TPT7_9AGAR|nr:hypothetical protein B0H15DRAFT_1027287 [Mycena belliae]